MLFVDELVTDPSPPPLQLHQRILAADQALLMPTVDLAAQPAQSIVRSTNGNVIGGAVAAPYGLWGNKSRSHGSELWHRTVDPVGTLLVHDMHLIIPLPTCP